MGFLNTIVNTTLDIIFPASCISCNKKGEYLCFNCLSLSPPAERESAKWIFPIYDYRHPVIKRSLWLLKYNGKKKIANIFAKIIYEKMIEELSELILMEDFREIVLVPIPLSKERLRERGYNQAELICNEIIKINNLRHGVDVNNFTLVNNILVKTKDTEHQARIKDRKTRLKNVVDSFGIKDNEKINLIKGKNIILIDDITTTGATLNEAKKVLKQSGAKKIIAFTVAH